MMPAEIPDAARAAPNIYRTLLENERVRVLHVRFNPGDRAPMHSHPDHVLYVMSPARMRITLPGGKVRDIERKTGETLFVEAGAHAAENIGAGIFHAIIVELKEPEE